MRFRRYARTFVFTIVIAVCSSSALMWAQERWATYSNPRFGTTADYPAHLFTQRDRPPENSDGQGFRTADERAYLGVYGAHNAENDTPQSYVDKYIDPDGVSFKRVTGQFFIVSGTRKGAIFYQRCNFSTGSGGIVGCFNLTYPAGEKAAWDPIVTRIGRSLRAGRG